MKYILILAFITGCTDRLYEINKTVNSYKYFHTSKMENVQEFIKNGGGDCKSFANVKYHSLLEEGISPDDMKFVIIPPGVVAKEAHAVLQVKNLILDNMNNNLTPASMVKGYRVNYSQMLIIGKVNE